MMGEEMETARSAECGVRSAELEMVWNDGCGGGDSAECGVRSAELEMV